MPTDEELQAAVTAATEKAKAEGQSALEAAVKAASNGKFTQEDLDRVAGTARDEGRAKAAKDLLTELGAESVEVAKAGLEAHRTAENESKSELQKLQEERDRLAVEAATAKADAVESRKTSALEGALRAAGLRPDREVLALKLADRSKVTVEGDEVKGLAEAVAELKTQSPEYFGKVASPPDANQGDGTGAVDFRTAKPEEVDAELRRMGVNTF